MLIEQHFRTNLAVFRRYVICKYRGRQGSCCYGCYEWVRNTDIKDVKGPQSPFWRMYWLIGLPRWLSGKESAASAGDVGDVGSIPGVEGSPRGGNVNPSSIPAWKIPWTEEPGGPQSMGLQGVRHDWAIEHAPACTLVAMAHRRFLVWTEGLGEASKKWWWSG